MEIGRIQRHIGPKCAGHVQRVVHKFENGKLIQVGETVEHNKVTFREVIEKAHNYFKRTINSFDEHGNSIKGSEFTEEVFGGAANKKQIRKFGVIG